MKPGLRHIGRFFVLTALLLAMVTGTTVPYAEAAPVKKNEQSEKEKKAPEGAQLRAATLIATVPGATILDFDVFEVAFYNTAYPVIVRQHNHADFTPETLSYFRKLFHSSIVSKAP